MQPGESTKRQRIQLDLNEQDPDSTQDTFQSTRESIQNNDAGARQHMEPVRQGQDSASTSSTSRNGFAFASASDVKLGIDKHRPGVSSNTTTQIDSMKKPKLDRIYKQPTAATSTMNLPSIPSESTSSSDASNEKSHDQDLQCPICKDLIREAFMTRCGHSFCYVCIDEHLEHRHNCPVCASTVYSDQIFPNFMLNRLLEKTVKLAQESTQDVESLLLQLRQKQKMSGLEKQIELKVYSSFLKRTKEHKQDELNKIKAQLDHVTHDLKRIQSRLNQLEQNNNTTMEDECDVVPVAKESEMPAGSMVVPQDKSLDSESSSVTLGRGRKRGYSEMDSTTPFLAHTQHVEKHAIKVETRKQIKAVETHFHDLEKVYFDDVASVDPFENTISAFSKYSRLKTVANLHYADSFFNNVASIVSSIDFDKDDEYFATAGVIRKIKIFDFANMMWNYREQAQVKTQNAGFISRLQSSVRLAERRIRLQSASLQPSDDESVADDDSDTPESSYEGPGAEGDGVPRYPIREISCRSKISCLSWNSYIKSQLLSSDYEGLVTLWDVHTATPISVFNEHEKRTWSVDFSTIDPLMFASGGDDTKVKLWSTNQKNSIFTIHGKANVCSVKFNPGVKNQLAFGSADHHIHYYDLRNISQPLNIFKGHRKAVSYVRFMNQNELLSASTDCSLRLWNVEKERTLSLGTDKPPKSPFGVFVPQEPSTILPPTTRDILQEAFEGDTTVKPSQDALIRSYQGHLNEKNFVGLSVNSQGEFIACGSETNAVYVYYRKLPKPIITYPFGNPIDAITGEEMMEEDPTQFVSSVCWKRNTPHMMVAANSQGRIKVLEMV